MKRAQARGIALIEVLVGIAILGLVMVFIMHTLTLFYTSTEVIREKTQALYLAEAGQAYLRHLRDDDWSNLSSLSTGSTHYLAISTTSITTTGTAEVIDGKFTRSFTLTTPNRDGNNDLTESGGTSDPEARWVTVTVAWDGRSVSLDGLLTNLHDR